MSFSEELEATARGQERLVIDFFHLHVALVAYSGDPAHMSRDLLPISRAAMDAHLSVEVMTKVFAARTGRSSSLL